MLFSDEHLQLPDSMCAALAPDNAMVVTLKLTKLCPAGPVPLAYPKAALLCLAFRIKEGLMGTVRRGVALRAPGQCLLPSEASKSEL